MTHEERTFPFTELMVCATQHATDPQFFKGLNPYGEGFGCCFKKCCKKYKRGKQCKKCPKR